MDFTNAGHMKIALLVEGMRIDEKAKEGLGDKWQEKLYSYSLTDWTDKKIVLPSDIKLDDRVYVGFRFNQNSQWELIRNKEGLKVKSNDGIEMPAKLIPRPDYYDLRTSNGEKMQSIGVSCGNHGVSFFVNSYCEYFSKKDNCKFCGFVPTQKKFSDTAKIKRTDQVEEVMRSILNLGCKIDFIQLSGGSHYDHDREVRNYIPFISTIRKELEKKGLEGKIPIHLTSMPPKNLDILFELKENGLDTISFDLECPTQQYFEKYCPGKSKSYGYKEMRKALVSAQDVFGQGNVYSIFILGLEPRNKFVPGIEEILKDGIIPTLNVYHYDPLCAPDMDIKNPNVEELVKIMQDIAYLFREYGAVAGRLGCAHYDMGHEIRKGYF